MKKNVVFCCVIIFSLFYFSCSKDNENLNITTEVVVQSFIKSQGIVVLKDYPQNRDFGKNEYYLTDEGLYIQVIDSGNGIKAYINNTVSIRYEYLLDVNQYVKGNKDTIRQDFSPSPLRFIYRDRNYNYGNTDYPIKAFAIPLDYVSEEAVINLIIPSSLGTNNDRVNNIVHFYKNLRYTRFN